MNRITTWLGLVPGLLVLPHAGSAQRYRIEYTFRIADVEDTADTKVVQTAVGNLDRSGPVAIDIGNDLPQRLVLEDQLPTTPRHLAGDVDAFDLSHSAGSVGDVLPHLQRRDVAVR